MIKGEDDLQRLLATAMEQAPFGVSILDADGRLVMANERFAQMFGRRLGDLAGLDATALAREEDRAWTANYLSQLVDGSATHVVTDKVYPLPDGTERRLRLTAWPLHRDGVCVGIVGVHSDAPPPAALADGRVRKLIENIDNTISLLDENGALIETSGRYRPILGYPAEFWATRSIFDLLHPDDAVRIISRREELLSAPGHAIEDEVLVRDGEGGYQPIHVSAVNLLQDPDVAGIVVTSRNVAAERQLERDLVERTRRAETEAALRSRLIATVSHELRNPLHAMSGLAELLSMSDLPQEAATLADTLHRQVTALGAVLDDLLESSRLDASGVDLRPADTALRPLVDDLVALTSSAAEGRPLSIRATVATDVPAAIRIDGARLRQVLSNLMGNAVKFTDEGHVELELSLCGEHRLRCRVIDTGRGIDADEIDSVFQPFRSARTAGDGVGAGLGLTIVRQVVTAMHGTIAVSSAVGEGSVFTVELPFAPADRPIEQEPAPDVGTLAQRVLVVEDNHVNQLLARSQLQRLGIQCVVAGTGEEALAVLARDDAPRIVLMDFQLPGIDGLETTRRIRASESPERRSVIIGVTASAMAADRQQCIAAGMDDFLPKPVSLGALGSMLTKWSSSAVPSAPDASPMDDDVLAELVDQLGDVAVVHQLIGTYLGEIAQRHEALHRAVLDSNRERTRQHAHALRSSSYLLGLRELGDLCRRLEVDPASIDATADSATLERLVQTAVLQLREWSVQHPVVS